MSEKPIIFSGPMVRAILAGKKTQTRRVVTCRNSTVLGYSGAQLWKHLHHWNKAWIDHGTDPFGDGTKYEYLHVPAWNPIDGPVPGDEREWMWYRVRPRIVPGDILWVKETFVIENPGYCGYEVPIPTDRPVRYDDPDESMPLIPHYRATEPEPNIVPIDTVDDDRTRWTSSRFMPKWASRIKLEVQDVRVERVQDISEEDIAAEGICADVNAWVFVYEFDRIKPERQGCE